MRSTFMGLEASKRGLFTQQSALYTTGHNISNANTAGYSRQRVNMQPTLGFPGTGLNAPITPGFIGTGVEAGSVQRIRDSFIDTQFRQETNKLGYWESRSQAISQIEDVLNEPSEFGLAKSLDEFWKSLQDLSVNPENGGARSVVVQRGIAVADSFNYMSGAISQIKENSAQEYGISMNSVNSILEQIADLNYQISTVEPNGYLPNDLYDSRDKLLDELGTFFPIEVVKQTSGGNALKIADGPIQVNIKLKDGTSLKVIDGRDFAQLRNFGVNTKADGVTPTGPIEGFYLVKVDAAGINQAIDNSWANSTPIKQDINNLNDLGKYKSLSKSYGYLEAGATKGLFPEIIAKLDLMAKSFAEEFNAIHQSGFSMPDPITGDSTTGQEFFDTSLPITSGSLKVNQTVIDNPTLLAASDTNGEEGNGKNALLLANMKFEELTALGEVSIQTFFQGVIGQLGVDGQQASRLLFNTATLQQAVSERRSSVSSVSLDEEMTNMITFQQAYNASARMITVVDETLDKIINGMGRVGL